MVGKNHWDQQAHNMPNDAKVNLEDIYQRDLENHYIQKYLEQDMNILEIGCGNGYSTNVFRSLVNHVTAFDISEAMIKRAKDTFDEGNNTTFLVDDILEPAQIEGDFDAVVCVRVLINLKNLNEQIKAINNIKRFIRPGGILILAEGFRNGFEYLDRMRTKLGLGSLVPAAINYYSYLDEILPSLQDLDRIAVFHLGMYDYLTRIYYPLVERNIKHNTIFNEQAMRLTKEYNPDEMTLFSRMQGFVFRKTV
jgi:SAM-dependent methyltransferase